MRETWKVLLTCFPKQTQKCPAAADSWLYFKKEQGRATFYPAEDIFPQGRSIGGSILPVGKSAHSLPLLPPTFISATPRPPPFFCHSLSACFLPPCHLHEIRWLPPVWDKDGCLCHYCNTKNHIENAALSSYKNNGFSWTIPMLWLRHYLK